MTVDLRQQRQRWRNLRAVRPAGVPVPRIAIVNKKGGSGKTTSSVTLAGIFASWGLVSRVTDGDDQLASTTFWLAPGVGAGTPTLHDFYVGTKTLDEVTYPTDVENLLVVPSLNTLGEVETKRPAGSDTLLAAEFDAGSTHGVDVEITDAAPSVGVVTVSLLAAATHVMITMKASGLDSVGASEIDGPLALIKKRLNPALTIAAVLIVDADGRAEFTTQVQQRAEEDYPTAIVATVPHSIEAAKAPLAHLPMHRFAPANPVTDAYYALAEAWLTMVGFKLEEAA
jgi:chromosome partitioning protein